MRQLSIKQKEFRTNHNNFLFFCASRSFAFFFSFSRLIRSKVVQNHLHNLAENNTAQKKDRDEVK